MREKIKQAKCEVCGIEIDRDLIVCMECWETEFSTFEEEYGGKEADWQMAPDFRNVIAHMRTWTFFSIENSNGAFYARVVGRNRRTPEKEALADLQRHAIAAYCLLVQDMPSRRQISGIKGRTPKPN